MKLITLAVLASTALVPAAAMAQGTGGPNQPNQANQASQTRRVAASDLEGREVYTAQGQTIGQIDSVLLGQNNQPYAVVSFDEFLGLGGESRLVPLSRVTLQGDRAVVSNMGDAEFRSLQTYRLNMAGFREVDQNQQVALGGRTQNQSGQGDGRIVVQRAAPTIRVDQADPRVTVRQQQPQVTVNQAQPEIIVRQPQPTVRVDIPQPEIIVRMPVPDVNVAMAQPQVQVQQPQPQVQVVQPQQQPQVQVDQSQPQVMVQRQANSEPEVQVQQAEGQPTVRYERAQPRVVVNQAQGQPNVRIERPDEIQQANAQGQSNQPQGQTAQQNQQQAASQSPQHTQPSAQQSQTPQQQASAQTQPNQPAAQAAQQGRTTAGSIYSEEQRRTLRERVNAGDAETTGAVDASAPMRPVAVSSLEDMNVYNGRGEELGEVDRIIVTSQGRKFVVVGSGGFLGIGRDRVAFPLERFGMRGDRLVIRGVTEEDIEAMDDYRDTVDNFQRVSRNEQENLRVWQ